MASAVDVMLYRRFYSLSESKQEGAAFLYGQIKEQLFLSVWGDTNPSDNNPRAEFSPA